MTESGWQCVGNILCQRALNFSSFMTLGSREFSFLTCKKRQKNRVSDLQFSVCLFVRCSGTVHQSVC